MLTILLLLLFEIFHRNQGLITMRAGYVGLAPTNNQSKGLKDTKAIFNMKLVQMHDAEQTVDI